MSFHSKIKPGRETKRARVLMVGSLMTPDGARRVTIRDISRTGAQVASEEQIPPNCDVLFKRGDLFAAAHVAWVNKGEAGLKFYREISENEIDGCLPTALMRHPPKR